jgi:Putative viral replication protein
MSKSRSFCFTLNNYLPEDDILFKELEGVKYLIYGREVGQSGIPHLQGYVVFNSPRSFNAVKKICGRCHWEVAKGDSESNRGYCSKDNDYVEVGLIPMSQKRKGEANAERWSEAKKAAIEGRLEDVPDDTFTHIFKEKSFLFL